MPYDEQAPAMTPFEQQLMALQARFAGATANAWAAGVALVTVPNVPLPAGWNRDRTTIRFVVPTGYPYANPDCFFAEAELRLGGEQMPQNTAIQTMEGVGQVLWFSWHLSGAWRPNKDSLCTWMSVVANRFDQRK